MDACKDVWIGFSGINPYLTPATAGYGENIGFQGIAIRFGINI